MRLNPGYLLNFLLLYHFIREAKSLRPNIYTGMSGIGVNLSFCKGYSIAMGHVIQKFNGATEWDIKLGMRLIASGNLIFQTFIVGEMIIYLIIIYGLHQVSYC